MTLIRGGNSVFMAVALTIVTMFTQNVGASESPSGSFGGYFSPDQIISDKSVDEIIHFAANETLSLIDYLRTHVTDGSFDTLESELPKYNRREHFYGWINADPTSNCLDTRTEVLIRDAERDTQVVFKNKCNVAKGLWLDPYSGDDFKTSASVQIDHVVPLKHAYVTGAAKWPMARRCNFANYLGNDFHLLAVSGRENMSKGGRGPEGYLPPNDAYVCQYVSNWLRIKAIWELSATDEELTAVEAAIQKHRCSVSRFKIPAAKLAEYRASTLHAPERCNVIEQIGNSRNNGQYFAQ